MFSLWKHRDTWTLSYRAGASERWGKLVFGTAIVGTAAGVLGLTSGTSELALAAMVGVGAAVGGLLCWAILIAGTETEFDFGQRRVTVRIEHGLFSRSHAFAFNELTRLELNRSYDDGGVQRSDVVLHHVPDARIRLGIEVGVTDSCLDSGIADIRAATSIGS